MKTDPRLHALQSKLHWHRIFKHQMALDCRSIRKSDVRCQIFQTLRNQINAIQMLQQEIRFAVTPYFAAKI